MKMKAQRELIPEDWLALLSLPVAISAGFAGAPWWVVILAFAAWLAYMGSNATLR